MLRTWRMNKRFVLFTALSCKHRPRRRHVRTSPFGVKEASFTHNWPSGQPAKKEIEGWRKGIFTWREEEPTLYSQAGHDLPMFCFPPITPKAVTRSDPSASFEYFIKLAMKRFPAALSFLAIISAFPLVEHEKSLLVLATGNNQDFHIYEH